MSSQSSNKHCKNCNGNKNLFILRTVQSPEYFPTRQSLIFKLIAHIRTKTSRQKTVPLQSK